MKNMPLDYEAPTSLHYGGKVAVFPNIHEAETAFSAALRPNMGGYRQVKLSHARGFPLTHQTFVEWFCEN